LKLRVVVLLVTDYFDRLARSGAITIT